MDHRHNSMIIYDFGRGLVNVQMEQLYNWDAVDIKPLKYMQSLSIQEAYNGGEAIIEIERTVINAECLPQICPYCDGHKYYTLENRDLYIFSPRVTNTEEERYPSLIQTIHSVCPFCKGYEYLLVELHVCLFCVLYQR